MKKFSFLTVMLALILGGVGAWWINGTASPNQRDTSYKTFEVTKGEGVRQVANNLKAEGLIKDPVIFFLFLRQGGIDGKVQAGQFRISPSMNASEVARALQTATNDLRVTIPEGKRAEEVADILKRSFPTYQQSWRQQLVANEGYLFPDTYAFPKDATIDLIIKTMTDNFQKKYDSISGGRKNALSEKEIVTIASMVEREAKFAEDRPLVSSVIFNRLNQNMPLYLDATVQYAAGTARNWWPTLQDTGGNILPNSPYNTYTHPGLPPTPISNPGVDVLNAVVTSPDTDYVYYISDKSGHNHYTKTLEQHNANIKKYGL